MADPVIPALAQTFTFRAGNKTLTLTGQLTKWSGRTPRRSVTHEPLKRAGAIEEDMARGPRLLRVKLQFIGADCAKQYAQFQKDVDAGPVGLLVHPTTGRWVAFCTGPQEDVDLARAINQIEVEVEWKESQLDAQVASDPPNVASAQQSATAQLSAMMQAVATCMAQIAMAATTLPSQRIVITAVLDGLALVSAPIDAIQEAIDTTMGPVPTVITAVNGIAAAANNLNDEASRFVLLADDLFGGDESSGGVFDDLSSQLDGVLNLSAVLIQAMLDATPDEFPADSGDAVGQVAVVADACMTIVDAVEASRPPTKLYLVKQPLALIVLAQQIIVELELTAYSAKSYAATLQQLNQIPNPAKVEAGTQLRIPTR